MKVDAAANPEDLRLMARRESPRGETPPMAEVSDQQIIDSFLAFVDREVMPLQEALGPIFTNQRLHWQEDGRENPAITAAEREARMRSAKAGFYTMFCPKKFGGEDLGVRLWFLCWEAMFHRYGMPRTPTATWACETRTRSARGCNSRAAPGGTQPRCSS